MPQTTLMKGSMQALFHKCLLLLSANIAQDISSLTAVCKSDTDGTILPPTVTMSWSQG
jgi:hypothetical protein